MKNNKKYKRVIAALVILFLTAMIEILANIQSLRSRYDDLEISQSITEIREDGKEKYQVYFEKESGIYVRDLKVTGTFDESMTYQVKTEEINAFGKVEEQTYQDSVNDMFSEYYTNIGGKIKTLTITMPKSKDMELTGVFLSNTPEMNKFRVLFVLIALLLLYCMVFEKTFTQKPEWYFVMFASLYGMLLIVFSQPVCNSWDDQIHFKDAYEMACGRDVEWSEASLEIVNRANPKCNTKAEFAQLRSYMNERGENDIAKERKESMVISYQQLAYLPMALFLAIGKMLRLPFSSLYAFGKLGNLLLYIWIMFWAIRLAKHKKIFLTMLAMMPTVLFLAASYTYDSVVFSFMTLGCVLWCREAFGEGEEYHMPSVIASIFLFSVGCLSKAVYIPFVLLMILIPQFGKQGGTRKIEKKQMLYVLGVFAVFLLVMTTFVLPVISNTVAGNVSYGGDSRGGDTSTVRQLVSMIKHPWASVKLMVGSVFQLDNFRNLGYESADSYFFGNLMFLNYSSLGTLADKWSILVVPMFTLLIFCEDAEDEKVTGCGAWKKVFMWGVLVVTLMLIWASMYLSFTPVGDAQIAGVQARYYLPLIYFFGLLCTNKRIKVRIHSCTASKMAFALANILQIVMVYELAFRDRLM